MDVMKQWYNLNSDEVIQELKSSKSGLTAEEAKKRISEYGFNELQAEEKTSVWGLLAEQFKSFLIIILLIAVILSVVVGIINYEPGNGLPEEIVDAIVIFVIVIAVVILGFIQEYRSEKSLAALRKMAALTATVIRGNQDVEIPSREIVPGDIVILNTGDKIPADLRLIEAYNLSTLEASLTGESTAVEKTNMVIDGAEIAIGDRKNMVFSGTTVTYGRGTGIATGTGMKTEFGKIASMLEGVEQEQTPLQKNLAKVGKWIAIGCLAIVAIIVALQLIMSTGHTLLEMFIWGVSLAVAAVPEALPAVVVISLSIGVQRMVKRHALVRRLAAVETLGSTSVICSDKTGTLTQDEMTVRQIFVDGKKIDISGTGYEPKGDFLFEGKPLDISQNISIQNLLKIGVLCNDTGLTSTNGIWDIKGDPTEGALVVLGAKGSLFRDEANKSNPRIDEVPFSSERKKMTTIHNTPNGQMAFSKGAPEMILDSCSYVLRDNKEIPLTEKEKARIHEISTEMASSALRVLGLGYRKLSTNKNNKEEIEKDMVFAGLVGMIDPPRNEAKGAIQLCKTAGIKTVMITGDHKITATAVAKELGILTDGQSITGAELDKLNDNEFERRVENIQVYARVSPAHKLRVIEAFSKKEHVVAMTGDGVNDAPALKKADIGVAMGITGTDVSKEAAAMVLTNDNFTSIVAAVEEGRVIFNNIKKYLMYLLSSNVGELLLMVGAILFGSLLGIPAGAIPLIAVQILLVNLITDGLPALALAVDPADPDIMQQKPRPKGQGIFTKPVIILMAMGGFWSAIVNLGIFKWALDTGKPMMEAQSLCFLTLIIIQFFKAYNFRSDKKSIFAIGMFKNKWLNLSILSQIVLMWCIVEIPALNGIFNTFPLDLREWIIVVLLAATIFPVLEIAKFVIRLEEKISSRKKASTK
jgi:P-type Ca2+ transporter type 2C